MAQQRSLYSVLQNNEELTPEDIAGIVCLVTARCREETTRRVRSMLTYGRRAIDRCGILGRVIFEDGHWSYCAGQSYTDEIRTVRKVIMGRN